MTIGVEYASDEPSTSTTTNCHVLAQVKWYGDHPRPCFVHSSLVVCSSVFDAESVHPSFELAESLAVALFLVHKNFPLILV